MPTQMAQQFVKGICNLDDEKMCGCGGRGAKKEDKRRSEGGRGEKNEKDLGMHAYT